MNSGFRDDGSVPDDGVCPRRCPSPSRAPRPRRAMAGPVPARISPGLLRPATASSSPSARSRGWSHVHQTEDPYFFLSLRLATCVSDGVMPQYSFAYAHNPLPSGTPVRIRTSSARARTRSAARHSSRSSTVLKAFNHPHAQEQLPVVAVRKVDRQANVGSSRSARAATSSTLQPSPSAIRSSDAGARAPRPLGADDRQRSAGRSLAAPNDPLRFPARAAALYVSDLAVTEREYLVPLHVFALVVAPDR